MDFMATRNCRDDIMNHTIQEKPQPQQNDNTGGAPHTHSLTTKSQQNPKQVEDLRQQQIKDETSRRCHASFSVVARRRNMTPRMKIIAWLYFLFLLVAPSTSFLLERTPPLLVVQNTGPRYLASTATSLRPTTTTSSGHVHKNHKNPGQLLQPRSSSWTATSLAAAPPSTISWLPVCTAGNVHQVALVAGCTGLVCQLVLSKLLGTRKSSLLKGKAGYTAHTIVALALMVLVSVIGIAGWWCQPLPTTPFGRLLAPVESCRWLAAVITGMFCLWDIPTSLYIKKLRKPDVIAHHILMAAVAWTAAVSLPMHYAFFYLGISELSSIPLIGYDQLSVMTAESVNGSSKNKTIHNQLCQLRDQLQPVAAVAFTWIRAILFTKITLQNFVPDVLKVLPSCKGATLFSKAAPLKFALVSSIIFTTLQLYWFSKMVRVVVLGEKETA